MKSLRNLLRQRKNDADKRRRRASRQTRRTHMLEGLERRELLAGDVFGGSVTGGDALLALTDNTPAIEGAGSTSCGVTTSQTTLTADSQGAFAFPLRTKSIAEIREQLCDHLSGATIITHGYQPDNDGGDSLMPLAEAIRDKSGGWLLDYDIPEEGKTGYFDLIPPTKPGVKHELVLLFDWAAESNELSNGWGEAAGDALFSMLIGLGVVAPERGDDNLPLHFIGHSFGTAVTSEAVERLAKVGVPVDHVTYLDPHDFSQGLVVDSTQRLFDLGSPDGYGASVWNNVTFADTYYQTRGVNGRFDLFPNTIVPEGRPIPGAYNELLDVELPPLQVQTEPDGERVSVIEPYQPGNVAGDHTFVWQCFYYATVTQGPQPADADCPSPAQAVDVSKTGYAYSRLHVDGQKVSGVDKRPSSPNLYIN